MKNANDLQPFTNRFLESGHSIVRSKRLAPGGVEEAPTILAGKQSQFLYGYFGEHLFGGRLPACMITHMRHPRVYGWFAPNRFVRADGSRCHEIALNTLFYPLLGLQEYCMTLVHEMTHLEQEEFGPWPRGQKGKSNGYHTREWVALMERVGLCPSNTGKPGGRKTGYGILEYVIEGGPFDLAFRELAITGFDLTWRDHIEWSQTAAVQTTPSEVGVPPTKPKKKDRAKFTCPGCRMNAWAKPSAHLTCTKCARPMATENLGAPS